MSDNCEHLEYSCMADYEEGCIECQHIICCEHPLNDYQVIPEEKAELTEDVEEIMEEEEFLQRMGEVDIDSYNRCLTAGAAEYGLTAFMSDDRDNFQDLEEELLDQINYAKFIVLKNRKLKRTFQDMLTERDMLRSQNAELLTDNQNLEDQIQTGIRFASEMPNMMKDIIMQYVTPEVALRMMIELHNKVAVWQ